VNLYYLAEAIFTKLAFRARKKLFGRETRWKWTGFFGLLVLASANLLRQSTPNRGCHPSDGARSRFSVANFVNVKARRSTTPVKFLIELKLQMWRTHESDNR